MQYYSKDTINKIGNAIIYLSSRISDPSKTKILKLLYFLEEYSVIKNKVPFFGIKFEAWQAGPVAKELFVDLSNGNPTLLNEFITLSFNGGSTYIKPKIKFNDDEFSDDDIKLMDEVINKLGKKTAKQLVRMTHKTDSAWSKVVDETGLKPMFDLGLTNSSDYEVDLNHYLTGDDSEIYIENKLSREIFNSFKPQC